MPKIKKADKKPGTALPEKKVKNVSKGEKKPGTAAGKKPTK